MDAQQALSFVALRLNPTVEPAIGGDEITQLLDEHALTVDVNDVEPGDAGYIPTYSRLGAYSVLSEAWAIKAGRVAHRFDFTAANTGGQFKVSQILDHCEAMSRKYALKAGRSVPTIHAV